ncbi:MAG: allantoate amidohydrolase [Kouleothrix sp.]|nr:allantoate amidohydrolase [Kouleothrix sp.]
MIDEHARTVMERCDRLAGFSEEHGRLTRRFATDALRQAGAAVADWMRAAGMSVRCDSVGNVIGRYEAGRSGAKTLLLGSHLDSVRDAGKYDGPLGVLVALASVQRLHDQSRRLPYAVELYGFADEEGVRYHTAYLGSKVVAGTFDPSYLSRADADGVTMAAAIRAFGGDPERLAADRRRGDNLLGYCEVHIEQGPVLEARSLPVGVVTAIAGQSRLAVDFMGMAGHAGTVPMDLRHDALCAAAEFILATEALARREPGLLATVGQIATQPGASNVIPGQVALSLDVRHRSDARRTRAVEQLAERAAQIAAARGVTRGWRTIQESPAVLCDPALAGLLGRAVESLGYPVLELPSGAGHDAVALSDLTRVAMLFVRCRGGVSHNPAESVMAEDVGVAIDVLGQFLEMLAEL